MHSDKEFNRQIRAVLDQGVEQLDDAASRRLRQARMQAVEKASQQGQGARWWKPAAAFAVAASLVLAVVIWPTGTDDMPASELLDVELMATDDSLQLYEELDFYQWLAEMQNSAG